MDPLYQSGHKTDILLRVQNSSENPLSLERNMKIAQLVFLKLDSTPTMTYDKQENALYNNDNSFRN